MADQVVYLAHGLEPGDALMFGLEDRNYGPGEAITVSENLAASLLRRGILQNPLGVVENTPTQVVPLTIYDEGTPLPMRTRVAFQGDGVSVADDPTSGRTIVTVPGGGTNLGGGAVQSVNGRTGAVVLAATDVGADPLGVASAAVANLQGQVDPFPAYLTKGRADALYGAGGSGAAATGSVILRYSNGWPTRPALAMPVLWVTDVVGRSLPPTRALGDIVLTLTGDGPTTDGLQSMGSYMVVTAPVPTSTNDPDPTPFPGMIVEPVLVTRPEAATLPQSGNGWLNAQAVASSLSLGTAATPSLAAVDNRVGGIAYTGALVWLATGKSDATLADRVSAYILNAPGTDATGGDSMYAIRSLGALLAAVDIFKRCGRWDGSQILPNTGGRTWDEWLTGLEDFIWGTTGNYRTVRAAASSAAGRDGCAARFAYTMIGVLRDEPATIVASVDLFRRWLGDQAKAQAFIPGASYRASWDNSGGTSGSLNSGVGLVDTTNPGRDGVVIIEAGRGGTDYSPSAPYFGASGDGITSQAVALDWVYAHAAVLMHLGYDVTQWSSGALLRTGDWMQRAKSGASGSTAWTYAETADPATRGARHLANWLRGGAPYGVGANTSATAAGLPRGATYGDWLAGVDSQWLRADVGAGTGDPGTGGGTNPGTDPGTGGGTPVGSATQPYPSSTTYPGTVLYPISDPSGGGTGGGGTSSPWLFNHGSEIRRENVGARLGIWGALDARPQVAVAQTLQGFTVKAGQTVTLKDTWVTGTITVQDGGTLEVDNVVVEIPYVETPTSQTVHGLNLLGGIVKGRSLTLIGHTYLSRGIYWTGSAGVWLEDFCIVGFADGVQISNVTGSANLPFPDYIHEVYPDFQGVRGLLRYGFIGDGYVEAGASGATIHSDGIQCDGGGRIIFDVLNIQAHRIYWPAQPVATKARSIDLRSGGFILTQNGASSATWKQIDCMGLYRSCVDGGNITVDTNPTDGLLPSNVFVRGTKHGTTDERVTTWSNASGSAPDDLAGYAAYARFQPVRYGPGTTATDNTWLTSGTFLKVGNSTGAAPTTSRIVAGRPVTEFAGEFTRTVGAAFTGTGTLKALTPGASAAALTASAPLSGTGTLAATAGAVGQAVTASMSGTGALTASTNLGAAAPRVLSSTTSVASSGATHTAQRPSGVQEGEWLIAVHFQDFDGSESTMTAPDPSWTQVGTTGSSGAGRGKVWIHKATAAEPTTYAFGGMTSSDTKITLLRVAGADATNPIGSAPVWGSAAVSSTSHTAPSINAPAAKNLLISGAHIISHGGGVIWTGAPAGMTLHTPGTQNTEWISHAVASQSLTANGATGTRVFASNFQTIASDSDLTFSLALAPVSATALVEVFRDDFTGTGTGTVDGTKWKIVTGQSVPGGPYQFGTGEIETNTAATTNLYQDGTSLRIKATKDAAGNWTSGRIESVRDDFQPKSGEMMRVEARVTLPSTANQSGIWPAFWMLGEGFRSAPMGWPGVGEIDILESVNGSGISYGTMHGGVNPGGPWDETTGKGSSLVPSPSIHGNPHLYAIEWDRTGPEQIRWYVDGNNFFTINASDYPVDAWERAVRHGFYVLINLAVGGAFPNAVAGGFTPTVATTSGAEMAVDYVRVLSTSGALADAVDALPFTDSFTAPALSGSWQITNQCSVVSGTARVGVRGGYPDRLDTTRRFDVRGKAASVQAVTMPASGSGEAYLQLATNFDNLVAIGKSGANLILRYKVNGSLDDMSVAWSASQMTYWRIVTDGSGGITWQTSADANTWTTRRTLSTGGPSMQRVHLALLGGHWNNADVDEVAAFDNVSIADATTTVVADPGTLAGKPILGIDTDRDITYIEGLVSSTYKLGARLHFAGGNMMPSAGAADTVASGRVAIIRLEPNVGTGTPVLDQFNAGQWDARIDAVAGWLTDPARAGKTIIITPFHEMNGDWYEWSGTQNGGQAANAPAKYRSAFRRVVTRLRNAGVGKNVLIGWNFNNGFTVGGLGSWNDYRNYYPGDDVVDIIGVDGYNDGGAWGLFKDVINGTMGDKSNGLPCYDRVYQTGSFANGARETKWCNLDGTVRPFAVFETGSREDTTINSTLYRKGDFIKSISTGAPTMPNLRWVIYFEVNKQGKDRRVDVDVTGVTDVNSYAAQSWRTMALDSIWAGNAAPVVTGDGYDNAIRRLTNLRYFLPLEETAGTTAADASGKGVSGTYVGTPTLAATAIVPSSVARSPLFSTAAASAVAIDSQRLITADATAAYSIGFVVRAGDPGSTGHVVYSESSSTTNTPAFFVSAADVAPTNRMRIFWRSDAGATITSRIIPGTIYDNNSHMVVLSYSNGQVTVWLDGTQVDQWTIAVGTATTTTDRASWAALRRTTNSGYINGNAGRLWARNGVTTAAEVATLWAAFNGA